MKSKIIYCINFIWTSFVAFSFPICFGLIYLNITGHAKGYSYDLGSEKDVSIMLGCVELLIWLALALPSNIYIFRKTLRKGKAYLLIPIAWYIVLAVICLMITFGGWSEYAKEVFHVRKIELNGNEDTDIVFYNGTEYLSGLFYCADDDRRIIGRIDHGARVYTVGSDTSPQYLLIVGRDNSDTFIAEGASVPTSGKITKILIDPGIRSDNSQYLSSADEIAVIDEITNLSGEFQTFRVDNYYTNGNAFYYVYNNSNVSCNENYGGYIAFTEGKWIYAPPENRPVWTGECNGVTIEALVIDDEEIIEKMCRTDMVKYIDYQK